jgi:CRISPR-associated protein Csd1
VILQQLYVDAERILGGKLDPEMYKRDAVRWLIPLKPDGRLNGTEWVPLGDAKRGKEFRIPYPGTRTSGPPKPALIVDNAAYVLGLGEDKDRPVAKHDAYRKLVKRCLESTENEAVGAVDKWLDRWDAGLEGAAPAEVLSQDRIAFEVGDIWPTNLPEVQSFWATATQTTTADAPQGECLISGVHGPTLSSMPSMLKGVPGGQTSGVALVSNNGAAFESYGHQGSHGAPMSRDAAEQFTKAINELLAGDRTKIRVGGLVYVFWTRSGPDTSTYSFLQADPDPGLVRDLVGSAWTGNRVHQLADGDEDFYAFALSASGARAVTRDWLHTTVPKVRARLGEWFAAQQIIAPDGGVPNYFSVYRIAASLYRDGKDIEKGVVQALIRSALNGDSIPRSLLAQAVLRCRAEQKITNARAALMKAILVTQSGSANRKDTAQSMIKLNSTLDIPAYHCGRLLAELDAVQRAALGKINTTLTDRYYGSASTTPSLVFGILLTNANKAHMPKLRKARPGVHAALEKRLEEILSHINSTDGFPRTLKLADQARFSLGFYHQKAEDRAQASAAMLARAKGAATPEQAAVAEIDDEIDI